MPTNSAPVAPPQLKPTYAMRSSSTLGRARSTSTARCRSLITWICSTRSCSVNVSSGPGRRENGASIAITTAPCCA